MRSVYVHFSWFLLFLLALIPICSITIYTFFSSNCMVLSFSIFSFWNLSFDMAISLDWISMSFVLCVCLISIVVLIYSYNYITPYTKSNYFIWLTISFVLSMLILILITDLFFCMLGWDGLGLISFLLIAYYQNVNSIFNRVYTLLINRLGDCFFIISISICFNVSDRLNFITFSYLQNIVVPVVLLCTFMTKRAIYPFSFWLPLAMSAPTPISALVHSSTLVTAGLYLIIRFYVLLYSNILLLDMLMLIRVFTSFYAGLNVLVEQDIKKIIALSTLRHLGFIGLAYSAGFLYLSFFHLLVHALFKSLIFIAIGDIIVVLNHSQDSRYLRRGLVFTKFSIHIIMLSLFRLLGLPAFRGFYSKDIVLESLLYSKASLFVMLIVYINIVLTIFYRFKIFSYTFSTLKVLPYNLFHIANTTHTLILLMLAFFSVSFSFFYIKAFYFHFNIVVVSVSSKLTPLLFCFGLFVVFYFYGKTFKLSLNNLHSFIRSMFYLKYVTISLTSKIESVANLNLIKSIEQGFLANLTVVAIRNVVFLRGSLLLRITRVVSSIILIFFLFLILSY